MKHLLYIILLSFFVLKGKSQNNFPIPKGYKIYKDYDNKSFQLDKDIDGDIINDRVIVYAKNNSEENNVVAFYLSAAGNNNYSSFFFHSNSYDINLKNNVVTVGSCFGNGRFCKTLKFRYYSALKTMRLIGYDEESFGNAANEGAYLKSVNLLTNKFEISGAKGKNKIIRNQKFLVIILKNVNSNFDYLEKIGSDIIE